MLKPGNGYGGAGVVFGAGCSPDDWLRLLADYATASGAVVQDWVAGDRVNFLFRNLITGRRTSVEGVPVLGPYLDRERSRGLLVRHSGPGPSAPGGPDRAVVNAANGAHMNAGLMWGR